MEKDPRAFDALYIAWKMEAHPDSAEALQQVLSVGEGRRLYRLRSWIATRGEARALLIPEAPLEEIAEALRSPGSETISFRWIYGPTRCAAAAWEIETTPVRLGLAGRPEEWRYSSAFND